MGDSFTVSSLEGGTSEVQVSPNYWAEKGKKLIDENYDRLYGVEDTSAILGITPGYFRDSFYTAYSIPPTVYRLQYTAYSIPPTVYRLQYIAEAISHLCEDR